MRFGILSPVVFRPPGQFSAWEADAGTAELVTVAEAADRLGYHHLTCCEHVGVPTKIAARRGGTYWDPLATLAFLAARTTNIRLATHVLVLGYHHPLDIAKRYGTLDRLSGGRVVLGLGVGSLKEEFALLGADFDGRGAAADDAIRALRAAWGQPVPEYEGTHYRFRDFVIDPHSPRPRVPLWIGGYTPRSLRRAVELGDAWVPFGLPPEQVTAMLATVDPPERFDVILTPPPLDPMADPAGTRRHVEELHAAGATMVNIVLRHRSADHCVDQLAAFRQLFAAAEWTAAQAGTV
ncbi:LLM class F420-dependent oxidoreductase [Dactylosporangium roseum]|uniref:LLM class F420-dependent oxidoreductase n=1 Tax=Dactylosporangium roseum TaxID=47989 RepID=A0ABY5YUK3_9ACTN|nr:LLM class F420-dependent oxidoreductase [Dactylosporangium roseum]UWZ33426.1 LLM class F420-dependent oxidoreductase [Dactylosporangium roseum]